MSDFYDEEGEGQLPEGGAAWQLIRSVGDEFAACVDLESDMRYAMNPEELLEAYAAYVKGHVSLIRRLKEEAKQGKVPCDVGGIEREC